MEEPKDLIKINRTIDKKYIKKICVTLGEAVIVFLYYFALNFANNSLDSHYFERGLQLCTMLFLFMAIFFYEKAYKKDSDSLALQGIEMMIISTYTLTIPYITKKYNFEFKTYTLVLTYFIVIYFILKSIVIYTKGKKNIYDDYSDIKEIVKNEPIKKEATKKEKNEDTEIEEPKKAATKKSTIRKTKKTSKKTSEEKEKSQEKNKSENKIKTTKKEEESIKEENKKTRTKRTTKKSTKKTKKEEPKTKKD